MCRQFGGLVKSIDMYGHQIQLNYKGESANKTFFGGMLSLISYFLVIGYFALLIKDLNTNESTVKTIVSYIDHSKESLNFIQDQFDVAIQIRMSDSELKFGNSNRYLSFYAYTKRQVFDPQTRMYGYSESKLFEGDCGFEQRMHGDQFYKDQRTVFEYDLWFCLQNNFQSTLQTNIYDMNIEIQPCRGSNCENNATLIKQFLNQATIRVYKTSKYFDIQEFEEFPVKSVVDVQEFYLSSQFSKQLDYKLAINKAEGSTSRLAEQLDKFEYEFFQSEFDMEQVQDLNSRYYSKLKFKISNEEVKVERNNKNFVEVLSETGGIMGIVIAFFAIFGGSIQELLFFSLIISDIFLTEERVRDDSQESQNNKSKRSNPRDESYKYVEGQDQQLEGGEEEDFDQEIQQNKKQNLSNSQSRSKSFVFVEGDPNSYFGLIRLLQSRKPFQYMFKDGMRDFIRTYLCCCRNNSRIRLRKQLYEVAKGKIEKQLDIANIIKQMQVLKLVSRVYLNRYQRKLVPFFKKNMLSNKLLRHKAKEEAEEREKTKKEIQEEYLQEISSNMIELFTDCQDNDHKSKKILSNILGQMQEQNNSKRTLQQKLFHGIMRKSLVSALFKIENELGPTQFENQDNVINSDSGPRKRNYQASVNQNGKSDQERNYGSNAFAQNTDDDQIVLEIDADVAQPKQKKFNEKQLNSNQNDFKNCSGNNRKKDQEVKSGRNKSYLKSQTNVQSKRANHVNEGLNSSEIQVDKQGNEAYFQENSI
eukprot:403374764